jgi:uncharacterized protein YjiS (DUF1127 family)
MSTADQIIASGICQPEKRVELRNISRFGMRVNMVWRNLVTRFQVNRLTDLDDRMLADIGIVRQDVLKALNVGLLDDPAQQLIKAAEVHATQRFVRKTL